MESWTNKLVEMGVCSVAVTWAKQYLTAKAAWKACDRPDWMLWVASLLATSQADRSAIILAAAACARTALVYVPAMEGRPLAAIEAAERWAREPNEQNRAAAWAAAGAAWAATRVAAWAARAAAEAAAEVAAEAAWAAAGAAWAAAEAAAGAARAATKAAAEAAAEAARVAARAAAWAAAWTAPEAAAWAAANREMVSIIRNFIGIKFLKGRYGLLIKKPSSKGKIKERLQ